MHAGSHASRRSERVETDHDDDPNIGEVLFVMKKLSA